jgi:hypothetical protein
VIDLSAVSWSAKLFAIFSKTVPSHTLPLTLCNWRYSNFTYTRALIKSHATSLTDAFINFYVILTYIWKWHVLLLFRKTLFYSVTVQVVILARRRHAPQCDTCWWYKKITDAGHGLYPRKEHSSCSNWWQYVTSSTKICCQAYQKTWEHLGIKISFVSRRNKEDE